MRPHPPLTALLAALLLPALLGACISATWRRDTRWKPLTAASIASLRPGSTDLSAALASLGAPLEAYETNWQGRRATALAWGWYAQRDWGLSISVPLGGDGPSPSFSLQEVGAKTRGLLLFFDEGWTLRAVRTGSLRDLLESTPRIRPSVPDDIGTEEQEPR